MPHFSDTGFDLVLCQICGRDVDTGKEMPHWCTDITTSKSAGNVCQDCLHAHEESGFTGGALRDYVSH